MTDPALRRIRIVKRPDGEAPEWIRDAWIGVEMPVLNEQPLDMIGYGILSGPRGWLGAMWQRLIGKGLHYHGFCVSGPEALVGLEQKQPEAALWWRENCPHLVQSEMGFLFRASECELLPSPSPWRFR
jgi:hypothetical protein